MILEGLEVARDAMRRCIQGGALENINCIEMIYIPSSFLCSAAISEVAVAELRCVDVKVSGG
jgi:hypothetical protein